MVALHEAIECRNDRPGQHPRRHPPRGLDSVHYHVGRHLTQKISDEQNADAGIVLVAMQVKILRQSVNLSIDHSIAIKEIEEIHDIQDWLAKLAT